MAIKFLNTVAVDTDVLYVDASSNRVGIGTTNPGSILHVLDAAPILKLQADLSVGSSTISFDNSLGTQEGSLIHNTGSNTFRLNNVSGNSRLNLDSYSATFSVGTSNLDQSGVILGATTLTLKSNFSTALTCDMAGKVGIGTTSPTDKLTVQNGNIRLNSTSTYPTQGLYAYANNSSPNMGAISWQQNPVFIGSEWTHYKQSSPYTNARIRLIGDASYGGMFVNLNGSDVFAIKTLTGNVGIGTTNPGAKLQIGSATHAPSGNLANNLLQIKSSSGFAYLTIGNGDVANSTSYIGGASGFTVIGSVTDAGALSEHIRITSGGNVGIGTTTPSNLLSLKGSGQNWNTSPAIKLWDSNNSKGWYVGSANNQTAGDFYIRSVTSEASYPVAANQEFTIKQTGNVGIGTISPSTKLEVVDTFSVQRTSDDNEGFYVTVSGSSENTTVETFYQEDSLSKYGFRKRYDGSTNLYQEFIHDNSTTGTEVYRVDRGTKNTSIANGNVGIGTTSPSEKLEVDGHVKAVDGYKGYVSNFHSGGFFHSPRSSDGANPLWIPLNSTAMSRADQYYNTLVPLYAGRIRKIILKHVSGSTPTATVCTFRKKINGVLSGTTYAGTVTGGGAAGMKVTFDFGTTDFTFNAEDEIQIGVVTGVATQPRLGGVSFQIWYEYNIT